MDSEQQRRYQEHLEYLKKSSSAPSQAGKPPMQNSPAKMKIQEELELLRKQQEQLQQLHEIERQMKQGSKSTPGAMPVSTSSSTQSAMTNTASYNEPGQYVLYGRPHFHCWITFRAAQQIVWYV